MTMTVYRVDYSKMNDYDDLMKKANDEYMKSTIITNDKQKLKSSSISNDSIKNGYFAEYIFERVFGHNYEKNDDMFGVYDFKSHEIDGRTQYLDLKTMNKKTTLEQAIKGKYTLFIQKHTVDKAKAFCDKNGVDYNDFKFVFGNLYKENKMIEFMGDKVRLSLYEVLKTDTSDTAHMFGKTNGFKIMNHLVKPDYDNTKIINIKIT